MSKKGEYVNVCFYCEKERECRFTLFVYKAEYPICHECTSEAKKDSFTYAVRK